MEMNVGYDWIGWIGTLAIVAGYYFNAKKIYAKIIKIEGFRNKCFLFITNF